MHILMIYPEYPDTYWSFKHALKFISKKAAVPPLGLITASAMLPENWQIIEVVNAIIKTASEKSETWSDEAESIYKTELKKKLISQFGKNKYNSLTEIRRVHIESESIDLLKKQMQKNLGKGEFVKVERIDDRVKEFLFDNFDVSRDKLDNLYHPSAIDVYTPPKKIKMDIYY